MSQYMEQPRPPRQDHGRAMMVVIASAAVAGLGFRALQAGGLNHTALVFVGIPALLALLATLTPRPMTAVGVVMKSVTIAMLLAGTLMGEAFVCLLMASPIIYGIAYAIAKGADENRTLMDERRRRMGRRGAVPAPLLIAIAAAIPAMEGVIPRFEFPRENAVTVSTLVAAAPGEVRDALAAPLRFDQPLPPFLQLGFPTPGETEGSGLDVGDERRVMLRHGHHHTGELVMRVSAAEPGRVVFTPVRDNSYIIHWLSWRSAEVRWRAEEGGTRVEWTLRYRRRLDPAWYFGPLERYGVRVAAQYLARTVSTPRTEP